MQLSTSESRGSGGGTLATSSSTVFPANSTTTDVDMRVDDIGGDLLCSSQQNSTPADEKPTPILSLLSRAIEQQGRGEVYEGGSSSEWSGISIEFCGARSISEWISRHPLTRSVCLSLADDFLADDFNIALVDRWPPWTAHLEDHCLANNDVLVAGASELLGVLRVVDPDADDFADFILSLLNDDGRCIENGGNAGGASILNRLSMLYTVLHQRQLFTKLAMTIIEERFNAGGDFLLGHCPRVLCHEQPLLPFGRHYRPQASRLLGYCPLCQDLYNVHSELDGALYGPTWCHFFLRAHWSGHACRRQQPADMPLFRSMISKELASFEMYVPRIFGFKFAANRASHADFHGADCERGGTSPVHRAPDDIK